LFKKIQAIYSSFKYNKMILFKQFVGIDISKKTFDATLIKNLPVVAVHHCFPQTKDGFTAFVQWLIKNDTDLSQVLICMEHTGIYTQGIIDFLVSANANLWVEMAIKIKRSMGLQRGGDDKASALVIAEYAMRFTDKVKLWKPADTALLGLRNLITQRDRIIKTQTLLLVPLED
jgi:transposase